MGIPKITTLEEFKYKDYDCVVRNSSCFDNKMGYVVIPRTHKFFKKSLNEVQKIISHDRLNYSGYLYENWDSAREAQKSGNLEKTEQNLPYVIGFDCGSLEDMSLVEPRPEDPSKWWKCNKDVEFVKAELKKLVDQIIALKD
jgi:hypothetical protein